MGGEYKIYISAVDIEIETEAGGWVEKVVPDDDTGSDKEITEEWGGDKSVSSPEWSEKVVSRSEGETYGDLTFFFGIDTHYGWHLEGAHADYDRLLADVVAMNGIVGEDYPAGLDGTIDTPAFLIHPGDATHDDAGYPTSYNRFVADYGFDGTDGVLNFPVHLVRGNHDTEDGIPALIVARHGDYKYRFEYGGIHFIAMGLFPQSASTVGDYYLDSGCSMAWVEEQLKLIGKNDRIILFQHYDYGTQDDPAAGLYSGNSWWSTTDADELLALIADYNVIAIMHGHNHGTILPDDADIYTPFVGYNILSPASGTFFVVRVTDTKLQVGQRYPVTPQWYLTNTQDITIPTRVTYSADKVIPDDGFGSDKEISS